MPTGTYKLKHWIRISDGKQTVSLPSGTFIKVLQVNRWTNKSKIEFDDMNSNWFPNQWLDDNAEAVGPLTAIVENEK